MCSDHARKNTKRVRDFVLSTSELSRTSRGDRGGRESFAQTEVRNGGMLLVSLVSPRVLFKAEAVQVAPASELM